MWYKPGQVINVGHHSVFTRKMQGILSSEVTTCFYILEQLVANYLSEGGFTRQSMILLREKVPAAI